LRSLLKRSDTLLTANRRDYDEKIYETFIY